jgi:hypothetical protein
MTMVLLVLVLTGINVAVVALAIMNLDATPTANQ